jgi:hypothetical protein
MENKNTITIGDLENVLSIIDYAANQGAFKGWKTMQDVLNVRIKISTFIEEAKASTPVEASPNNTEDTK